MTSVAAHSLSLRSFERKLRPLLEPALAVSAAAALLWLRAVPRGPEPLPGAVLGPFFSAGLALAVVWVAPGLALQRLWRARARTTALEAAALALALGLAWALLPCVVGLLLRWSLRGALSLLAVLTVMLALALAARAFMARDDGSGRALSPPRERGRLPFQLLALAALAALLAVAAGSTGFTFGGDEWPLMASARYFLEAPAIQTTRMFDAWGVLLAVLVRLAGLDLVEACRRVLPPFFIIMAAVAFLALARALLRRWSAACLAFCLQALYCLSDMHTRGEGAGMALLARIVEDKYAGLLLAVPLAQVALLRLLRTREPRALAAFAAATGAALLLHPLALFWIGIPALGALWPVGRWRRRVGAWVPAALLLAAGASLAAAALLRSLRPAAYFQLHASGFADTTYLLRNAQRQLLILSPEKDWYMGHPALLAHPLLLAAILATLALVPGWRRSARRRFLICGMLAPLALVFNPLTAGALGRWITPWAVHRLLWALPVSLVLAHGLQRALSSIRWRWPGTARPAAALALWLLPLAATAVLLGGRIERSLAALRARNRVYVSQGERELMLAVAADSRIAGIVLAPRGVSVRLPAWTSRPVMRPGLAAVRTPQVYAPLVHDVRRFLSARTVGDAEVDRLRRWAVDYVVVPSGSRLEASIAGLRAFPPVFRGSEYAVYAWRPEHWPTSRGRVLPQPTLEPPAVDR